MAHDRHIPGHFAPGIQEPGQKPRSAVKKDETVHDEMLDRAVALIKARDVLGRLKGKEK